MTRRDVINHLAIGLGLLAVVGIAGWIWGLNSGTWWLLGLVVVVLHLGLFAGLIAWVVARVKRLRKRSAPKAPTEEPTD